MYCTLCLYSSVWRASYNEKYFGSKMWCKIKVVREEVQSGELQRELCHSEQKGDTVVSLSTGFSPFVLADLPQLREKKSASSLTLPNTTSFVRVVTLEQ